MAQRFKEFMVLLTSRWGKASALSKTTRGAPENAEAAASEASRTLSAAQLHALYLDDVYRYVAYRIARREDAEDITAEVFAAAFEALPRFRGEVEPRLWLLGIARRKVADLLRSPRRRRETTWDDIASPTDESPFEVVEVPAHPTSDPAHTVLRDERRKAMRELLALLKDEQREALLLKYVEDLSIEEIAVVMGRSKAAANSLLQRARATAFRHGQAYFLDFLTQADTSSQSEVTP